MTAHFAIWAIAAGTVLLILIRPRNMPEAVWASGGAGLLLITRAISPRAALTAVGRGTDVYLFLTGMMILAELARRQGVFDWIAAIAVEHAHASRSRLFLLIYAAGTLVTIFLSNDATAVVLTPAVFAVVKRARAKPLPYLLICAFIANAASFVLPISNPANLVFYGSNIPPLAVWLRTFALPSALAIVMTYAVLRFLCRSDLHGSIHPAGPRQPLSLSGKCAAYGIAATALALILASALGLDLGLPTAAAAFLTVAVVALTDRQAPLEIMKHISWSVLPLVAGLFVLVESVNAAGALTLTRHALATATPLAVAFGAAIVSNTVNNLPAGLIASSVIHGAHYPATIRNALLLAVDLGPNLSITGSLATILWLVAIRREGEDVTFAQFLRYGALVMPPALLLALLALYV